MFAALFLTHITYLVYLLLFFQADNMLRDSIAILRQENSQLMVEINELKNDFGLREDQVYALTYFLIVRSAYCD